MLRSPLVTACLLLALATSGAKLRPAAGPPPTPSYPRDIAPLLQAKCIRCHGDKVRRAGLDLRTHAAALKGGESGPAVVPGAPDKSPLFEKTHSGTMPPAKKDRLSEREVEAIRRWIAAGAKGGSVVAAVTQQDAVPILLRRCAACHGARRQEGQLDVRTRASLLRGGKSGPAIVLGQPEKSLLIEKVHAGQMPPRARLVEASVKPMEEGELAVLRAWIAAGAPEVNLTPDVATTAPDPLVTDRDRDFWAFRPPRAVAVPRVRGAERVRNPIDAFILARLEAKGLTLSPEADRVTLLRRATFDLTGLPPTPEEVEHFLSDKSPDAYERVLDRLLASPRNGERWGRFWLDLAGYADSEGKREQDLPRPHAWRYRDYVIRAFNDDKPFARFLTEQLAGDELADYRSAPEITPEIYDNLVATGFLRMAPDATWANITNYLADRVEVIADEMDVLGSAVLGLTVKCARCHSHKFDPIPQRDYYRLLDIFKGAFDEHDWLKPDHRAGDAPISQDHQPPRQLPFVTTAERRAWQRANRLRDPKLPRLPEPRIHALWDRGAPSPTYLHRRGDPFKLGELVGPGVPSVLTDGKTPFVVTPPWPGATSTGRRLAFARWVVRDDHPLTWRVAVNRIWQRHFGQGIVASTGNFGKAGTAPTHPELLDWLAREFVRQGGRVKAMHRLMMTSATYRQRSAVTAEGKRVDADGRLYSRMPMVRLDAEALYDAHLFVAGRLDEARFGPPDAVAVRADGLVTPVETARGWRRMVYVRQARKQLPTHLELFDHPQMSPNCLERRDSTVAPQALHLLNNGMVRRLAEAFAERVMREAGEGAEARVRRAHVLALGRAPGAEECAVGVAALRRLEAAWAKAAAGEEAARRAMTSYCHALLGSAAFVYVD